MIVTLVLQLVAERLSENEVVGSVERVDTGERALLRDVDDLVGFARRAASADERER